MTIVGGASELTQLLSWVIPLVRELFEIFFMIAVLYALYRKK